MPDVLTQATIEVYVTRPDGQSAVAQMQIDPEALGLGDKQRQAHIGQLVDPLVCWGLGDERYELTLDGLVARVGETEG